LRLKSYFSFLFFRFHYCRLTPVGPIDNDDDDLNDRPRTQTLNSTPFQAGKELDIRQFNKKKKKTKRRRRRRRRKRKKRLIIVCCYV